MLPNLVESDLLQIHLSVYGCAKFFTSQSQSSTPDDASANKCITRITMSHAGFTISAEYRAVELPLKPTDWESPNLRRVQVEPLHSPHIEVSGDTSRCASFVEFGRTQSEIVQANGHVNGLFYWPPSMTLPPAPD